MPPVPSPTFRPSKRFAGVTEKSPVGNRGDITSEYDQVPFDGEAALESARIRIDLEARGMTIGPMDLLIAGTALSRGAILVTNNTKEFSRIKGLRLADWTS